MDRLRAIEVFTAVARGRSFSAAAAQLGIAKGNVTKHVKWLEDALGARLFSRTTKSVSLTDAGISLLESGQDLLDRFDAAEAAVRGTAGAPKGVIRIGTPPSFGAVHVVPLLTEFSALHPDIQFALHLDDGHADVAGEGLDLTVRIAPSLQDTSLVARRLGRAPQVLVASPAYVMRRGLPQSTAELAQHDCLVNTLKSPTGVWAFTGNTGKETVRVPAVMRSNFGEALRHAALLGAGISMHPTYMVADDLVAGRLLHVLPEYEPTQLDIFLVYPHRRNLPRRVKLLLDFLQARFRGAGVE